MLVLPCSSSLSSSDNRLHKFQGSEIFLQAPGHPNSTMRLVLGIGSKARKFLATSSVKENVLNGEGSAGQLESKGENVDDGCDAKITDIDNKEEAFFDSQAWLDSDCEEDFVSVNGDFVPSRGSTPNYEMSNNEPLIFSADTSPQTKSEPPPTAEKKRLAQLLQENRLEEELGIKQDDSNSKVKINGRSGICKLDAEHHLPEVSAEDATEMPGTNSPCTKDGLPSKDYSDQKDKMVKTQQCCLPSLAHSLSFRERRKRKPQ
ncbi:unnamed protein product [Musa acuminata subsp. malaccensis]|uniref:(wild Malaysian banana) hypothetical protein n=1 Tax=Musa acuminata subsp. malaccensis TaxID=214687 RepID=A0A804JFZ0_MUSAM|nr:PREDICTED: uncharacterized protein At3g27210-like [Musa acuminata subsp. malaccensis]CAG1846182.1 unnamed protein product [Musa acuminata subsp. malaccensis]